MTDERICQFTWDLPLRLVGSTSVWPSWPASIWVCSTEMLLPFCLSVKRDEPKYLLSLLLLLSLSGKGAGVPFPKKAILTSYHPEAHQVTHTCRVPADSEIPFSRILPTHENGHVQDFLTYLQGILSVPGLFCAILIPDHCLASQGLSEKQEGGRSGSCFWLISREAEIDQCGT